MGRYIDADDFYKSQVKRCGYNKPIVGTCTADNISLSQALDAQPAADVVEVVRCKDCRFCQNLPNGLCYAWTEPYDNERGYKGETHCVEPDDFCSMGQRKEQT